MKLIIQRVNDASVYIKNSLYSSISKGYLIFASFCNDDKEEIINKMVLKLINLRIFEDSNGKTNLSLKDVSGEILSVSQFTLYADCKHGNRPSFTNCMEFNKANEFYEKFNEELKKEFGEIKTGIFGEDMKINLVNDGPFTIILDSKELF